MKAPGVLIQGCCGLLLTLSVLSSPSAAPRGEPVSQNPGATSGTGEQGEGIEERSDMSSAESDSSSALIPLAPRVRGDDAGNADDVENARSVENAGEESRLAEQVAQGARVRRFEEGRNAYLYGNYQQAIDLLTPLLEPTLQLAAPEQVSEAYSLLGLAHFYLNHSADAERVFSALIFFQPEHQLDPVQVPPEAVSFFNALRERLADQLLARQQILSRSTVPEEEVSERVVVLEQQLNSPFVAALPFGIGQFQNGDQLAGSLFLISELLMTSLSAGLFWYIEAHRGPGGRFPREDFDRLQRAQQVQLISGGLSVGLMVIGAAHALLTFQPRILLKRTTRSRPAPPPSLSRSSP